ncbi:MAG: AAA family ATPase [Magnetococcus sp. YQC-5]
MMEEAKNELINILGHKNNLIVSKEKLKEMCEQGKPFSSMFVRQKNDAWLLGGHYKFDPDILIVDTTRGTLGIVYLFEPDSDETSRFNQVQNYINKAAYTRHLLFAYNDSFKVLPMAVELVLVYSGDESLSKKIGYDLARLHHDGGHLHAIGINLLHYDSEKKSYAEKDLRRAFCWLLSDTKTWFESLQVNHDISPICQIDLGNYRAFSKRTFKFAEKTKLHLIHGHNGSGKSSLVEAMELVLTGEIERIENDKKSENKKGIKKVSGIEYDNIIRLSGSIEPASIAITLKDDKNKSCTLTLENDDIELKCDDKYFSLKLYAPSFRLNQAVMSQLADSGDAMRAEVFLKAFFSDDSKVVIEKIKAEETADKLTQKVQEVSKEFKDAVNDVLEKNQNYNLDGFRESIIANQFNDWELFLPLKREFLDVLSPMSVQLEEGGKEWLQALSDAQVFVSPLTKIQHALQDIKKNLPDNLIALQKANELLIELNQWQVQPTHSGESRDVLLNRWLESVALADIAQKRWQIAKVLSNIKNLGDSTIMQKIFLGAGLDEKQQQELQNMEEECRKEGEQAKLQLEQERGEKNVEQPARLPLSHDQILLLDKVGAWILPAVDRVGSGLGNRVQNAIRKPWEDRKIGDLVIGSPDWANGLLEKLQKLIEAADALDKLSSDALQNRYQLAEDLWKARKEVNRLQEQLKKSFLDMFTVQKEDEDPKNSVLANALNELMALFTPARWAYEDLTLRNVVASDFNATLSVKTETGQKASLSFNTAEMNLFTLALFLLCAPRVSNSLRLLILDDPLQNMDEHTVSVLARGMARLSKMYPKDWQLMLLFHGEDDVERFRREAPTAVYYLPWLPKIGPEPEVIQYDEEKSLFDAPFQDLWPLFEGSSGL